MGGKKILHRDFRLTLLGNLLAQAGQERNVQRPICRTPAAATQVVRLEEHSRKLWPILSATRRRCRVCSARGVIRNVSVVCQRYGVALCVDRKTTRQIPETFQALQLDLPTQNWGPSWKCKEKKFKILKINFYLGSKVLCIFNRTTEISVLLFPCWSKELPCRDS